MPQSKVYGVNECKVYGVNECKVYGVECKGEVIVVIILCQDLATAKRALDIIQRDLGSQLLQVEQCNTVVGAYLSTLRGFNPSECLSFYHYHLDRSLQSKATIYLSTHHTKGGQL